ncbi:MAG: entericidin, EcnA/B family [Candidatus Omnitrophota bacterium]|nr:MAG: entericidin, EcnA/B family [Candidatus Omnitrophota bacterium]
MVVVLAVGVLMSVCLQGCSTIKGAGKDVQSVGRGMERASDNVSK